jgi:hypothetical protein
MSDDLVERVAQLYEANWGVRDYGLARAVIAACMEEAAKVAETYHNPTCNCEICYGHEQAAAAIRAMIKES